MTITAKFTSRCACCGGHIRAGEQIEWTKGSPAVHVRCAGKVAAPKAKAKAAPKPRAAEVDTSGCEYLSRRSLGRDDSYAVGDVLYLTRYARYVTVVSVDRRWRDDDSDEWMIGCYARPATAEESAPVIARRADRERQAALVAIPAWIARRVQTSPQAQDPRLRASIPADAWRYAVGARMAGSETLYASADAIYYVTSSYDDGPCTWCMPLTRESVSVIADAIEVLS